MAMEYLMGRVCAEIEVQSQHIRVAQTLQNEACSFVNMVSFCANAPIYALQASV